MVIPWEQISSFDGNEVLKFRRLLRSMSCAAQSNLCQSSVLIVGAGGLGCPVAMYLAAAGVGRLGIVDHDAVELNNLHRQIAHRESTVGTHKCDSAGLTCRSINSNIQVTHSPAYSLSATGATHISTPWKG